MPMFRVSVEVRGYVEAESEERAGVEFITSLAFCQLHKYAQRRKVDISGSDVICVTKEEPAQVGKD